VRRFRKKARARENGILIFETHEKIPRTNIDNGDDAEVDSTVQYSLYKKW